MASNGTSQSYLYNTRGAISDGNSTRNRSMEQQYYGGGNPYMPMWNTPQQPQYGAGGQQYGYSRYQPPMMTGFNNQQWVGQGQPYSYNTPNSYGSNYGGGNFYTPYGSSAYGGASPSQNPLPLFGGLNDRGYSTNRGFGGGPTQNPYAYQGYGGQQGGQAYGSLKPYGEMTNKPYMENGYGQGGSNGFMPNWAMNPPNRDTGVRFGRQAANPDQTNALYAELNNSNGAVSSAPSYSPAFSAFLGMGY